MTDSETQRHNCVVTFSRLLSPNLLRLCSTLVYYDYDDLTDNQLITQHCRLELFALRSLTTDTQRFTYNGWITVNHYFVLCHYVIAYPTDFTIFANFLLCSLSK